MITKTDRQKIEEYLAGQGDIDVAYLFGSQANGKANKLSDVDIAVLFNKKLSNIERFRKKLDIMGSIGSLLKRNDVEVVDLNSAPLTICFSAIENRDLLYVGNNDTRVNFESGTSLRYQDYNYFMNVNSQISLLSISRMEV